MDHGDYRSAFLEGFRARRERACSAGDNPYSIESIRVRGWDDGWQAACDEDVRDAEQFSAVIKPINL
jgi:hypothetical protein